MFSFAINVIFAKSKTIPTGLTALPSIITYIIPETKPYFSLMFLAFNIPLIIFFWKKIKRKLIYMSLLWMAFQNIFNVIFNIEVLNKWLHFHFAVDQEFEEMGIDKVIEENKKIWPIIYYTFLGSTIIGLSLGIAWKNGATSGGSDFFTYYYSTKKKRSIGRVIIIFNLNVFIFSFIILILFTNFKIGNTKIIHFFGVQAFSTILYIFISSYFINIIYPKYKKVEIDIYTTNNPNKILKYLKEINYWHSYNLWCGISGYTGNKIYKIKTICFYLESNWLLAEIYKVDPNIWVSFKNIERIKGNFDTSKMD
ncbi:Uncharacterized BCR, YitT family COG1284 [Mesomycoplasma neurolyticum]|uniref:Uncharacterized BCR, YitT family COG1284 n=1 Tax=Mesomycoplasma neurolyticum TaxID=2120 RepID=A0A449A490_9BACT|nr:Uncharacterized BCR, YitT family COG1284 [Mesomycoplasma neurolyticum]